MRDKKGEGYIDAAVVVFCVMFVIALGVRIFPVFITKIQLDNFADELVRVTLTLQKDLGLFGKLRSFPVTIRARASGKSEVYWK